MHSFTSQKRRKMKGFGIPFELSYTTILIAVVCLLLSLGYTAIGAGPGAYMNAIFQARARNWKLPGFGSAKVPSSVGDFGSFAQIPPIKDNPHLEEIDERLSSCNGIDIREITISEIQRLFAEGTLTSVQLTQCYIERIEEMDKHLHSVIEINPAAIADAFRADLERQSGSGGYGMMHGIPVLLKENIATYDQMETTAGSLALLGIRPKNDADFVKTLRKSGAVILGKANLSEFAYFRGTNIPSGWSGRGGQTRNAYNMNESPEGSSSGSAVSVSANLVTVSIGTETDGSLIAPASIAGICTLKPTLGTPSTKGVIPISHNQDTVGPMARTVMDLAILLDAIVPEEFRPVKSYPGELLAKRNLNEFRIGVFRYPYWNTTAINSTNLSHELPKLELVVQSMKGSVQFTVLDPVEASQDLIKNVSGSKELIVLQHDFKHDINQYLREEVISPYPIPPPPPIKSSANYRRYFKNIAPRKIACLQDIIQFNKDNPTPEEYNQALLESSEETDGLHNETYVEARDSNRKAARDLLDSVFDQFNLDAIVTPSESRNEGMIDEELKESPVNGYSLAAIAGYPSVNIPAGIGLKGVPFGISFLGRPHTEAKLLEIAYAVEQLNPLREPPQFLL